MSIPVSTQVTLWCQNQLSHLSPSHSKIYSLSVQEGDAPRSKSRTVLRSHRAGEGNPDLADLAQELCPGSVLERQPSWSSYLNYQTYFPNSTHLLHLFIYNASELPSAPVPFFPVVHTHVNMHGLPAFWELLGASATGKISLIKDNLNHFISTAWMLRWV